MIAEFTKDGHRYGLTTEKPDSFYKDYRVVFSLYKGGTRSSCAKIHCDYCPFYNPKSSSVCVYDYNHYLPMFGIAQDTHPEYFI